MLYFVNWPDAAPSKIGPGFTNKRILKLKLDFFLLTTNGLLNWYSSMKINWKISVDFWHRKLTLKLQFRHFSTEPHFVNLQNTTFSLKPIFDKNQDNFGYPRSEEKNWADINEEIWIVIGRKYQHLHQIYVLEL